MASIAIAVAPRSAKARVVRGLVRGARKPTSSDRGPSSAISPRSGGEIFKTDVRAPDLVRALAGGQHCAGFLEGGIGQQGAVPGAALDDDLEALPS